MTKEEKELAAKANDPKVDHKPVNNELKVFKYDMAEALGSTVDRYLEIVGDKVKLRPAKTPFIDENLLPDGQEIDEKDKGALAPHASSILMSLLYTARLSRFDLLRPVCALASCVTRWTTSCDRMLYKLICYVNTTKNSVFIQGYIGDNVEKLEIRCYTDADLAGDKLTKKSTTGIFLALVGPNSWFPMVGISTKQTAVSHASTESELVGADHGVRK